MEQQAAALPLRKGRPGGRRTVAAVTIGNAIEFYDFLIYSLFAIQIGEALFPPMAGSGNLVASLAGFGIGFLARPLGALVIGRWSDRVGRKPPMVFSVMLVGLANGALALIPAFQTIGWTATVLAVLCRLAAGFALGGELGCNSAYLAEASDPARRAFTVSWQGASQSLGFMAAAAMAWGLSELLAPADFAAFGWRIALMSGVVAVPFALWLRIGLQEPLPPGAADPVEAALPPGGRVRLLLGVSVILLASTIASYVLVYLPTYAQATLGLDPSLGFRATTVSVPLGALAYLAGGWLADRLGRRPLLLTGSALAVITAFPAFSAILGDMVGAGAGAVTGAGAGLMLGASLLAVSQNFGMGALFAVLTEGLPRRWRGAGFGLLYASMVGVFGGATQPVLAWALERWADPWLPVWLLVAAGAVQFLAALLVPETRPEGEYGKG